MFTFSLRSERSSYCNHRPGVGSDDGASQPDDETVTFDFYCPRCHEVTRFDRNLTCPECMHRIGS